MSSGIFGRRGANGAATIILIPFRLIKLPLTFARFIVLKTAYPLTGGDGRARYNLPVSGIDESKAQSIYFALQRAAATPREQQVAALWLHALQVAQVASGRLLAQLAMVDQHLEFWNRRLERGGHFWFALLRRGPVAFAEKMVYMMQQLAQRLRGRSGEGGGSHPQAESYDTELVEARVLLFRVLRAALCEAVAAVHESASSLYLNQAGLDAYDDRNQDLDDTAESAPPSEQSLSNNDGLGTPLGTGEDGETLFGRTEHAVRCTMLSVIDTFDTLKTKSDDVLKAQSLVHRPADNAEDRAIFSQTLLKALGVTKLKKIWTQTDVTHPLSPQMSVLTRATSGYIHDQSSNAILRKAQRMLGYIPPQAGTALTVHDALWSAHAACFQLQRARPLVNVPKWMKMPTMAQQHWIRYSAVGLGCAYGCLFVIKHSPMCGSRDLENWVKASAKAVQSAWSSHVIEPLENLQGELFNTFRRRPSIVSIEEYEADRDSLRRMLEEFKEDMQKKKKTAPSVVAVSTPAQTNEDSVLEGMEVMMHSYESELKRPIKNLVAGDLMRSLLIQVQKMKVDTESAMLEIDQILKANELSISLVAAIPAFIMGGACLYALGRFLTPSPPDPRREATGSRLAMIDVERSLESLVPENRGTRADIGDTSASPLAPSLEQIGEFWYRLAVAFDETELLFERHKGLLRRSANEEWMRLRADMLALASQMTPEIKLRSAARMLRVYSIYQR